MAAAAESHDGMSLLAIMQRADALGLPLETYDPNRLVEDIKNLLAARGLHPGLLTGTEHAGAALGGAGVLLRALGIAPLGGVEAIDRVNATGPEMR